MREITTFTGKQFSTDCIGCAMAKGILADYPGTLYSGKYFHAHQDVEIPLPGFIIVASCRHVASFADFSAAELREFAILVRMVRKAQYKCGLDNVYLFQNEDSSDHFHLWMFPVYDWMRAHGKGLSLASQSIDDIKIGRIRFDVSEVISLLERIKENMESLCNE